MWTHKKLDIGYHGDAIVDVNLTSEAKVKLEPGARISFTYEVCFSVLHLELFNYTYQQRQSGDPNELITNTE